MWAKYIKFLCAFCTIGGFIYSLFIIINSLLKIVIQEKLDSISFGLFVLTLIIFFIVIILKCFNVIEIRKEINLEIVNKLEFLILIFIIIALILTWIMDKILNYFDMDISNSAIIQFVECGLYWTLYLYIPHKKKK